jgi:hypothetical protein
MFKRKWTGLKGNFFASSTLFVQDTQTNVKMWIGIMGGVRL